MRKRIPGDVDLSRSSAIRIDGIGATAGRPFARWRSAIDKDVVHLGQIASAIEMSHGYAAEREGTGSGEDHALEGESVIARKRWVRAGSGAVRLSAGSTPDATKA